jgi:hypothetical protein
MTIKAFRLTRIDQGGIQESQENLHLICLIKGDGKLVIWGSAALRQNIDAVQRAKMPCEVECDCIRPKEWAIRYGHSYWVPEGNRLRVITQ